MLDVEKIKLMTKIAFFEEKEEAEYTPVLRTNRRDYVGEKVLIEFFVTTIIYLLVFLLFIAIFFLTVFDTLSKGDIILILVIGLIGYVVCLFFRMHRRRKLAKKEYNVRNRKYKELKSMYEDLDEYYKETGIKA